MHECKVDNCRHPVIKFCDKCGVPYCEVCGKEWAEKCALEHYYPPVYYLPTSALSATYTTCTHCLPAL